MFYEHVRDGVSSYYAWCIAILSLLLLGDVSIKSVLILGTLMVAIQLIQVRYMRRFFALPFVQDPFKWERYMVVISFGQAFILSAGAMFLIEFNQGLVTYALICLITIPAFISAIVLIASAHTHYAWMLALQVPIVIKAGFSGDPIFLVFGALVLFGGIPSSYLLGKKMSQSFIDTLQLRFENEQLLKTVNAEKERAEKANTDKSRFLASASHDLRQPLHALDLFLTGLKNRLQSEENVTLLLQAQASSRALGDLLNALLDVSRLDAGEVKAQMQTVHLPSLLQDCCSELAPVAKAKGLCFTLRQCSDVYVKTDAVLLTRILRNVISNAIRYTNKGGVLIGFRRRGALIRIEIWDTGKGIEEQQQQYIFDEYYQIDNPERDSEKGLGLGLAIVKRISELLEHPMGFHSSIGKGSCFYISVPVSQVADLAAPIVMPQSSSNVLSGLFVLVIDDHQPILDGMRNLLRDWDCEVLFGQSLDEILKELQAFDYPTPDVMLVDYRLRNNETGDDAIDAIRMFFNAEIPAVLMTGEMAHDMETLASSIDVELMRKPVPAETLKRLLHQYTN